MTLGDDLGRSVLNQPLSGAVPLVVRLPYQAQEEELILALHMREADYEIDEDGRALSNDIWRFRGHVSLHEDEESGPGWLVYGYVFDWTEHWLTVLGEKTMPLYRDSIYQVNPRVPHGAIARYPHQPLIVYIQQMLPRDAAELSHGQFREKALQAARKLVWSPPPKNELL